MPTEAAKIPERFLITGGEGFVAPYVVEALRSLLTAPVEILGTGRDRGGTSRVGSLVPLDITDFPAVEALVGSFRPDCIVHLAGISDVGQAHDNAELAWRVNLHGTLNLANAALKHCPASTFLFAGSCQVYGRSALHGQALAESDLLAPVGEYGATKAAADLSLGVFAQNGLRTLRMRPFNHIGPGQKPGFALPSFARQIALIELGLQEPVIKVGNIDAERDFLDVRDVANAYALACLKADKLEPGSIFNIGSGCSIRMREILDIMIGLTGLTIAVQLDDRRWRANDIPVLLCDPQKARRLLEWQPRYKIEETLAAILGEARQQAMADRLSL